MYIELNPEFNGNRDEAEPLPISDGDVPALLPPPLVPTEQFNDTIFALAFYTSSWLLFFAHNFPMDRTRVKSEK